MAEKKPKSLKDMKVEKSSSKGGDLEKIKAKVRKDLEIDQTDLKKEISKNGVKYHYYLELFIKEKKDLNRLKKLQKRYYKKLYHKMKFENEFRLKTTGEVSTYINGEPKMAQLNETINNSEDSIEYLERVLDLFKMRSFSLRNLIDVIKLESGGFA